MYTARLSFWGLAAMALEMGSSSGLHCSDLRQGGSMMIMSIYYSSNPRNN